MPKTSKSRIQTDKKPRYVEAVLPVPIRRAFTYRIPAELDNNIQSGTRLQLPFGKRTVIGYAVAQHNEIPADLDVEAEKIKDIIAVLDDEPLIVPEILELTKWAADYYASYWGEMLKAALPAGINSEKLRPKRRKAVRLLRDVIPHSHEESLTDEQYKILELLETNSGEMLYTELIDAAQVSASPINTLAKRGYLEVYTQNIRRDPLSAAELPAIEDIILTDEQSQALDAISGALSTAEYRGFLLRGVTGSGKTEVYLRAMRKALEAGKSALMLVPEISLTPIFSRRLRAVFGNEVAILHSNLSAGERYDEWQRIRAGDAKIVIGTRSAIFAPLENIGLLIVDEEHDPSYRQHESPYYNARDLSVIRANFAKAVVVLGSATPSIESYFNVKQGKYIELSLPSRIGALGLANAELIDMREVFRIEGKHVAFSPQLLDAIRLTASAGEQSIILLNRRGFSQFVFCRTCGETIKCVNCDIALTYHKNKSRLVCHYCNYQIAAPSVCPICESIYLYFVGEGTEHVETILEKIFPDLRIARVDRDTMSHKGELEDILLSFSAGRINVLVGTQMITKGHHFPNVTLAGVVSVDIGLGLPDFRSAERTFQLITQVAGRSGRGDRPGKVLIQTYYPNHYALRFAREQNYASFYEEEIRYRERLAYPPFFALASIVIKNKNQGYAKLNANILRRSLDGANMEKTIRILGPAPASLSKLKKEFRFQILLKATSRKSLRRALDIALHDAAEKKCDMRTVSIEIDPVNLM